MKHKLYIAIGTTILVFFIAAVSVIVVFIFSEDQKDGVELNQSLGFEGSLRPSIGYHYDSFKDSQNYFLSSESCFSEVELSKVVTVDTSIDNKNLLVFGENYVLSNNSFCIDQKNGHTYLHVSSSFKKEFSKQETLIKINKLILGIKDLNVTNEINKGNKNLKSWN